MEPPCPTCWVRRTSATRPTYCALSPSEAASLETICLSGPGILWEWHTPMLASTLWYTTTKWVPLVDAEGPVTPQGPWHHLQTIDGWARSAGAANDQCHLRVQVIESWFLIDMETIESFYGQGFRAQALPPLQRTATTTAPACAGLSHVPFQC